MVDKHSILLDSVRKLLELGISDREIILNLKDVGIPEEDAAALIEEARTGRQAGVAPAGKQSAFAAVPEQKKPERKPIVSVEAEPGEEALYAGLEEALEEGSGEGGAEPARGEAGKREEKPAYLLRKAIAEKPAVVKKPKYDVKERAEAALKAARETPRQPTADIGELWRRGVLATVDSKLDEMEKIKRDIEKVIDGKVREVIDREMSKIRVVFDSQKTLLMDKINSELGRKGTEITNVVNSRLDELMRTSKDLQETLDRVVEEKETAKDLIADVEAKVRDIDKVRSTLVGDVNRALLESSGSVDEFLAGAKKTLDEMDARVNSTLEVSSKITEGILRDAQGKIDELALAKSDALENELKKRLASLDEISRKVKPEMIEARIEKLNELITGVKDAIAEYRERIKKEEEAFRQKLSKDAEKQLKESAESYKAPFDKLLKEKNAELAAITRKFEAVSKYADKQIDEAIELQKVAWDKVVKDKTAELAEIPKKLDLASLETLKQELDMFKEQFVNVVKKNVTEFNKAKDAWLTRMEANDKALQQHIKAIDAKMAELTEFEKNFAAEMGLVVEKLAPQKQKAGDGSKNSQAKPKK